MLKVRPKPEKKTEKNEFRPWLKFSNPPPAVTPNKQACCKPVANKKSLDRKFDS